MRNGRTVGSRETTTDGMPVEQRKNLLQGMFTHSLSRHGEDALGHILYIGCRDASHGNAAVVGEVNVRILANLEHLGSQPREGHQGAVGRVRDTIDKISSSDLVWSTKNNYLRV